MKICGVRFKDNGKTYFFKNESFELNKGDKVVVITEKGEQYAKVYEVNVRELKNIDTDKMKDIIRVATAADEKKYFKNLKDAHEAVSYAKKCANEMALEMSIIDGSFTLDRKQLTINFIADERIDFRELVKQIAAKFKTRIELHQVGARDKAKEICGLGQCGRELCCSKFLNGIDTISINMAKNQNIALNPSKINGACGRLLCCLAYEDDTYTEHRKKCPKLGQIMNTEFGKGKVVSVDPLNLKYQVEIDEERKEIKINGD